MGTTLVAFAEHMDQWRLLRADRTYVARAVEEVHRWRTLTQVIPRRASVDEAAIQGVTVPLGATVELLVGAANRDPARWTEPDRFDVRRPFRGHLGFGYGLHICLGLSLARLESQVWLDLLLDSLPAFEVAAPLDYGQNFNLRAPREVHVVA
jgi:cytochrome P450